MAFSGALSELKSLQDDLHQAQVALLEEETRNKLLKTQVEQKTARMEKAKGETGKKAKELDSVRETLKALVTAIKCQSDSKRLLESKTMDIRRKLDAVENVMSKKSEEFDLKLSEAKDKLEADVASWSQLKSYELWKLHQDLSEKLRSLHLRRAEGNKMRQEKEKLALVQDMLDATLREKQDLFENLRKARDDRKTAIISLEKELHCLKEISVTSDIASEQASARFENQTELPKLKLSLPLFGAR